MRDLSDFECRARDLCDRLALGLQAAALVRAGSPIADAFCALAPRVRTGRTTTGR